MQSNKFSLNIDPIQEMDHLRGVISQESISLQGIVHSLTNLIPTLQKNFQGFIKGFSTSEPAVKLKGNERDFIKLVDSRVYLNLAPLQAYVPEGLDVPYLEYLMALRAAVDHVAHTPLKVMNDYSVYLAQIITNRELKATTMPLDSMYVMMEKKRKDVIDNMAKCFKAGSSRADSTYGEVVGRNGDWVNVFTMIEEIDSTINKVNRGDLHKKAEECDRQLQTIIKQIRNHEFDNAGPEVTNNLANGAYQCGAELEFFAATFFRVTVMNNAVSDTMNKVSDIIKQSN